MADNTNRDYITFQSTLDGYRLDSINSVNVDRVQIISSTCRSGMPISDGTSGSSDPGRQKPDRRLGIRLIRKPFSSSGS